MDVLSLPRRPPAPSPPREAAPQPISNRECFAIASGFLLCLLICFVYSHRHIFWEDELLGWMLLRDPSWHHMIAAWKLGADGGGFAFYLTGRAWFAVFGPSEISLRMYSAATLGLAFALTWIIARRFYTFPATAFALFNTWFFSRWLPVHMAEGRFYGLLMLAAVAVVWLTVLPARAPGRTRAFLYPLIFALHALLTASHLLGIVYSASLLAAMVFLDRLEHRRFRPALYACAAATWLLLIPERQAIFASAQVGKPHFWTTQPTLSNFLGVYTAFSGEVALTLLLLAILLALTLRRAPTPWQSTLATAYSKRRPIWIVTLALLLVPVLFVMEGHFGPSVFVNRYLMPITLAQVFLTAELTHLVDWPRFASPAFVHRFRWPALALYAALLLGWVFGHTRHFAIPPENYTRAMTSLLPRGIPVVCEDAWQFTELLPRQHTSGVEYVYLLDWPESISPNAPLLEVTQFHLMQNWQKAGFFSGSILDAGTFLKTHDRFLVLHQEDRATPPSPQTSGNPLVARFRANPAYRVRLYAVLTRAAARDRVFLVCRGTCPIPDQPVRTATIPAEPD